MDMRDKVSMLQDPVMLNSLIIKSQPNYLDRGATSYASTLDCYGPVNFVLSQHFLYDLLAYKS